MHATRGGGGGGCLALIPLNMPKGACVAFSSKVCGVDFFFF